jgi:hypothetical protein
MTTPDEFKGAKLFRDRTWRCFANEEIIGRPEPRRVVAELSAMKPGSWNEESGIEPYVVVWYDGDKEGGFDNFSPTRAEAYGRALIEAAGVVRRAYAEAKRRGIKMTFDEEDRIRE